VKRIFSLNHHLLLLLVILFFTVSINSQPVKSYSSSEIKLALNKLNVLGTILYLGAHPDDENTEFLSYYSSGKLMRTGYLSLTRGDGGQNLISDDLGDLLGVIRTQELVQARKLDGAEQFFTRAVDFGYTKSPKETFKFWNKAEVLSDVIWVIRKFKPDVIVTRFPATGEGGHGQHTASAILALEAFRLSGDSSAFPEQLEMVDVWTPKRIFWNGWSRVFNQKGINQDTLINVNLGSYSELLGQSYPEIAARSRSMHKSQGFGDSGWRGNYLNYFLQMDGTSVKDDLFTGIDITWNRVNDAAEVSSLIEEAIEKFDEENPSAIIPVLIEAYKKVNDLTDNFWSQIKSREILELIRGCAGIWIEAVTKERVFTPGSEFIINTGIVNRSNLPFKLEGIYISYQSEDSLINKLLLRGDFVTTDKRILLPLDENISQPYWLQNERSGAMFNVSEKSLIGNAENRSPLTAHFRVSINETVLVFNTPVLFRENDPTQGEVYSPVVIAPLVTVNLEHNLYLFPDSLKRKIRATLKCNGDNAKGKLKLYVPDGWRTDPPGIDFILTAKNEEQQFIFDIFPPAGESTAYVSAKINIEDKIFSKSMRTIKYNHISTQTVFPAATSKLVKIDLGKKVVNNIGYIMGSGDKIPDYLEELGFDVDILTDENLSNGALKNYDVIISGIRAYNTNERMEIYQNNILEYVNNGGTFIAQYNTLGKQYAAPGPYELKISRDRVTEEDADVKITNQHHQVFNFPNKIIQNDFNGWIQERGLYFPDEWDEKYEALLEMKDEGETPKQGSLLFTRYGKGIFIYTGLSFFREFPAGVPGAYKLFINLISSGKDVK
jgi:LmbE family N-acetylglucosaminyl deacetylase